MERKISEQKLNIDFVKEVENFPCIYDYRRLDYARKDVVDKAWTTIGKKFELSGPQCRERWKNLRTVLSRNLRPSNGRSRASKQQRKPYYLFDAMKFAVPFIKSHNTVPTYFRPQDSSNSPSDQDDKSEDNGEEDNTKEDLREDIKEETKEDICYIKVENTNCVPSRTPSPQYSSPPPSPQVNLLEAPSPTPSTPTPRPGRKRTRRNRAQSNDSAEVVVDENVPKNTKSKKPKILNKIKMDVSKISKKRFLLSLLSDVYSMDNAQMRSFRLRVLHLINDITQPAGNNNVAETLRSVYQRTQTGAPSGQAPDQSNQKQSSLETVHTTVVVKIEKEEEE